MRFAVLGSGSQGNGTLIASGDTFILVDCGFSLAAASEYREAHLAQVVLKGAQHAAGDIGRGHGVDVFLDGDPVSYTHLTLPTICSV